MKDIKEFEDKLSKEKQELNKQIDVIINSDNYKKVKTELVETKAKYLGKNSFVQSLMKEMGNCANEDKPKLGQLINTYKTEFNNVIEKALIELQEKEFNAKLNNEKIDITEPVEDKVGSFHPIKMVVDEVNEIFGKLGYEVITGPEIEKTEYVFDMLNISKDHPARDIQDTFYIEDDIVLRSHTSSVQIRTILKQKPPIKIICPGKVYRSDAVDATHSPVFHQLEGLVVDKNITMADLKGTLEYALKKLLGENTKVRFRPHYFAYTEPSAEVDVSCFVCGGTGCKTCQNEGWIELLGCGMVHPDVLKGCGIDPEEYQGFAFGFGIERIAMAKYGVNDMRLFFENDIRFLDQF